MKVFLHCDQILKENTTDKAVIKSLSGDTDIVVLGVSLFPADIHRQWHRTEQTDALVRKF